SLLSPRWMAAPPACAPPLPFIPHARFPLKPEAQRDLDAANATPVTGAAAAGGTQLPSARRGRRKRRHPLALRNRLTIDGYSSGAGAEESKTDRPLDRDRTTLRSDSRMRGTIAVLRAFARLFERTSSFA